MTSQYETKRLITFDRIKIKSNYKYLLNTKVKFNEMFHSRSGEKIGIFYSSKDDINIPYNLYIAVSYIKQTLTLEFSSKILKEKYPNLDITVIVRGYPVVNDATMEDAEEIGLTDLVRVIGNGSNVGGTWIPGITSEARDLLYDADLIIAKGQGNFETLNDCGLNIYYLFLCKCDLFQRRFHAENLQGMFLNERRLIMEPV